MTSLRTQEELTISFRETGTYVATVHSAELEISLSEVGVELGRTMRLELLLAPA